VSLQLHQGKFLDIVTDASVIHSYDFVKQHLSRIDRAFQACELADHLTQEGQDSGNVYFLLVSYLDAINNNEAESIEKFKRQLLVLLGFMSEAETMVQELDAFIESITERKLTAPRIYE
jgi:DNA repair protein RecO